LSRHAGFDVEVAADRIASICAGSESYFANGMGRWESRLAGGVNEL
jgi:hypothetical protein